MKVLMFGWEFPPHISGGLGTACYGLAKGLLQNEVELIFVVPKAFGDEDAADMKLISATDVPMPRYTLSHDFLTEKFTYYGLNSVIVPYLNEEQFEYYTTEQTLTRKVEKVNTTFTNIALTGKYGKNLMEEVWNYSLIGARIAEENEFDVIHAHDWLSFPAGLLAKQASGKPLIAHVHATEFDRTGENVNASVFDIERQGMEMADRVVAVSEFTKQIIVNRYGIPADKVDVVHNATETQEVDKEEYEQGHAFNEKIITYLGRVTYQKGPEYFVEAAAKVLKKDKNFRFVMAGSGDMLNKMIEKAAKLRISANFHFTGFLKGDDVDRMFAISDVYVMPSVSEPFGISPLEAVRSNVPVIISNQSGVKEVLKHAMKVDFWDTDAMANAIYALAKFEGLAKMFVRESRLELDNLKWSVQAAKMKEIYSNQIEKSVL